ncbi:hypothetical protein MMC30_007710 [Trapelia coarctata]|nr:hypothetical protein [Trapelia coarctata]
MSPFTTPLALLPLALTLLLISSALASTHCALPTPNPIFNTPIPLSALPTLLPAPSPHNDLQTIRNTLALYPFSIDGKNFAALDRVFTPDIVADYSAPLGILTPLTTVMEVLQRNLQPVRSQHVLGTTWVQLVEGDSGTEKGCKGPTQAISVTYYSASHFGTGVYEGEVFYAYGQYQDSWVKNTSTGAWRIGRRNLVYMGPVIGNVSILTKAS